MEFRTNQNLKNAYLSKKLTVIQLVEFLTKKGFTTKKPIEKTALGDLEYNGKKIKSAGLEYNYLSVKFK